MNETTTKRSVEFKQLVAALCKVQGSMKPAVFNKKNPHFKSEYADLSSCFDSCRSLLSENGLCVMQFLQSREDKTFLVTLLSHISGEWIETEFPIISSRMDSQGIGSAMTYAKRYSLCALLGIVADEDDDGNEAVKQEVKQVKKEPENKVALDEFIKKHRLFKDDKNPSKKYEYLVECCSQQNVSHDIFINKAIQFEQKFEESFKQWLDKKGAENP